MDSPHRRHERLQSILDDQHPHIGVGEHAGQAIGRQQRIERQVSSAGFENAEQSGDQVERPIGKQAHGVVRTDAERLQVAGDALRPQVQLGVGEPLALIHHRQRIREAPGLRFEQLVDRGSAGVRRRRVVPMLDELGMLALGEQRQACNRYFRVSYGAQQQALEMSDQPADRGAVEQIGRVLQREAQPVSGAADEEGEIQLGRPGMDRLGGVQG